MSNYKARIEKAERTLKERQAAKRTWPDLPIFYCGHYLDPQTKQPIADHSTCCFMHWRGLPKRAGKRHPLYSWQVKTINDIEQGVRYLAIYKPPKVGATELFLSYFLWKALQDPLWINGQVGILVGTSLGETEQMISRAKSILAHKDADGRPILDEKGNPTYRVPLHYSYNNKKEFTVNTVKFMAHPAGHYDAIRAKPNMKAILGDEIAFFIKRKEDQQEIRDAFEHYKGAGLGTIVALVTTAGAAPAGFAYDIFKEKDSLYHRITLGAKDGLEIHPESGTSILDAAEVEEKRLKTPGTYRREFEQKWGHDAGNVFLEAQVDRAIECEPYKLDRQAPKSLGIDPGFGSSRCAFVLTQLVHGRAQVLYSAEFERADFNEMLRQAITLYRTYYCDKIYVDASKPEFIRELKARLGEDKNYEQAMERLKKDKVDYQRVMKVVPVAFGAENDSMLNWAQEIASQGMIDINEPENEALVSQMRACKIKLNGTLDKDLELYTWDLIDALFLSLKRYHKK